MILKKLQLGGVLIKIKINLNDIITLTKHFYTKCEPLLI